MPRYLGEVVKPRMKNLKDFYSLKEKHDCINNKLEKEGADKQFATLYDQQRHEDWRKEWEWWKNLSHIWQNGMFQTTALMQGWTLA